MRSIFGMLACLLAMDACVLADAASAQNPFLQNRGKRTIDRIEFVGNTRTLDYVLRRELGFEVGDEYDPERIGQAWERLEALDFVAYVEIETERPDPTSVELIIQVEEDTRFRWSPALDYSRRQGDAFSASLSVGMTNLRGRAESFDVTASAWARRGLRAQWQNPWILGVARIGVGVEAGWQRHTWEYESSAVDPDEDFTEWGGSVVVWRDFDPWVRLSTRLRWREVQFGDASEQDPTIGLAAEHDTRDARYYPANGQHARVALQFGGFAESVEDYVTSTVSASNFATIPYVDTIVAAHGAYRGASATLPEWERTFLGGPMTVRGIGFGTVPGDEAWRASVELRRPLLLLPLREGRTIGLGAHVFHDWGAAWDYAESASDAEPRFSYGAGLHFNLNTRNFRFEWAHTDDGEDVFVFEDTFSF